MIAPNDSQDFYPTPDGLAHDMVYGLQECSTPVPIVRSLRPYSTPERTRRRSAFGCRFRNYRGRLKSE